MMNVLTAILVYFFGPETFDKTLEEVRMFTSFLSCIMLIWFDERLMRSSVIRLWPFI
jgi:hypothetical protein